MYQWKCYVQKSLNNFIQFHVANMQQAVFIIGGTLQYITLMKGQRTALYLHQL